MSCWKVIFLNFFQQKTKQKYVVELLFICLYWGRKSIYTYLPTYICSMYIVHACVTVCLLVPAFCISFYLFSMKKSFEVSQELSQQSLSWFTWLKVQISMQYKITLLLVLEALWLLFVTSTTKKSYVFENNIN